MDNSAKKIIVIDDEPDMVFLLQSRLEAAGYRVSAASDGAQGLDRIRKEVPDLVILDVMMPKVNGYQVCREIRKNPDTQNIPVLMLTAKSQESDRFWGIETGANAYLTKPFDAIELMNTVQKLLGK